MTFKEIYDLVITKLQENSSPEYWTESEIKDYINRGYKEFVLRSEILTQHKPMNTLGSGYYLIPDDSLKILGVYYKGKPLTPVSENQLDAAYMLNRALITDLERQAWFNGYWRDVSGEPQFYVITDYRIRVVPFPDETLDYVLYSGDGLLMYEDFGLILPYSTDEDVQLYSESEYYGGVSWLYSLSNSIFVRYVKMPSRLIVDEDIPEIPTGFHEALAYWALYECFAREGDVQDQGKAAFYLKLFNNVVDSARDFVRPTIQEQILPFYI